MSDAFLASYILLWFLALASLVLMLATARQVALLTKRFPFYESGMEQGPNLGETVLAIRGHTLDGGSVTLGPEYPVQTVLAFVSDSCSSCNELLPELEELNEVVPEMDLWFIVETAPATDHPLATRLVTQVLVSPEAFEQWEMHAVPYLFLATREGNIEAKGHISHVDRLRQSLDLTDTHVNGREAQSREPARQTS